MVSKNQRDSYLINYVLPITASAAVLLTTGLAFFFSPQKMARARARESYAIAGQAYMKMSGKDRVVSTEESRGFLDFVGYEKPIGENEIVFFRPPVQNSPNLVTVVIGSALENDGKFLSGSKASSGRVSFQVPASTIEDYLTQ